MGFAFFYKHPIAPCIFKFIDVRNNSRKGYSIWCKKIGYYAFFVVFLGMFNS
ncbi:hypothetical protein AALP_AA1G273300 [Arabis alpina]|uniref:Uncharacterized protein n=1 Tax=Arabis alpina TaxID=50452 RepID=A0A087HR10_ARAAL|nr:hypothetical protein AALP_AA1G273300 [Arabis alpina]